MRRAYFLAAFIAARLLGAGLSPETGSYIFTVYSPEQYGASPQNWGVVQDKSNLIYFANTDGVLQFDGLTWRLIRLPDNSPAKSIATDETGTVYVGGQGVFGFLKADEQGRMVFVSLLEKVPQNDRKFIDVWRILPTPSGTYFSSYARLFRLDKSGVVRVWKPTSNFGRAFHVMGNLYVKTPEQGLLQMVSDSLVPVPGGSLFTKLGVPDAVDLDGDALVATPASLFRLDKTGTVRPFPTGADAYFAKNLVYTIRVLPGGGIAAGTRNGGLVLLSPSGVVDRIVTKAEGLPDDQVTAIFADVQGGVWIVGNDGIGRYSPGTTRYDTALGLEGDVQCMEKVNGVLFVGTSKGLYRMQAVTGSTPRFQKVEGIDSRVWALEATGEQLLAATELGLFQAHGSRAKLLFDDIRPKRLFDVTRSPSDPTVVYTAGTGTLVRMSISGTKASKTAEFSAAGQEFRSILEDTTGIVWATTKDAAWRIDFNANPVQAVSFGERQGMPVGWKNAKRLDGRTVVTTVKGLRRFAAERNTFLPDPSLGEEYSNGSKDVFNIFDTASDKIWITGDKYHALLFRRNGKISRLPSPLIPTAIQEIYSAKPDSDGSTWAVGAKGILYRWDPSVAGNPDAGFHVSTRRARNIGTSTLLFGGGGDPEPLDLPWAQNGLRFEFAAPFHENPTSPEYQVLLEGNDQAWSPWTHETQKDYTHLPEGSYRFHVRARTPHGTVAEDASVEFTIRPPWYRTWWAYGIYLLLSGFGVSGVVSLRTRQLERDKHELEAVVAERTVEIRQQRDEIHAQERKSQSLLLNILPATVADELKATGAVQPVGFDDVTVCFTDFVGFTLSSEKLPPAQLVDALNEYFTAFDEIVARHGLEKLKTIGDSYMFASGLPVPRASHAVDAVLAALEMVAVVQRLSVKAGGTGWDIRVGLHSGPVVAGVVGTRKFAFDIWGNTVNFAARMESSGVAGRVNISEHTHELLRGLIRCEERGRIKIKEGRELPMFLAVPQDQGNKSDFIGRYQAEFGHPPEL